MCDTCFAPVAHFECAHCGDWQFCSEQCAEDVHSDHVAVCYETENNDAEYLSTLLGFIGIDLSGYEFSAEAAHEVLDNYLAKHDFPQEALHFIEKGMRMRGGGRRRMRPKKKKLNKKGKPRKVSRRQKKIQDGNNSLTKGQKKQRRKSDLKTQKQARKLKRKKKLGKKKKKEKKEGLEQQREKRQRKRFKKSKTGRSKSKLRLTPGSLLKGGRRGGGPLVQTTRVRTGPTINLGGGGRGGQSQSTTPVAPAPVVPPQIVIVQPPATQPQSNPDEMVIDDE